MKKDKETQIPPDHPIREIWENNQKSFIDLAYEGDKDAIKSALANFCERIYISKEEWVKIYGKPLPERRYDIPPELIEYLVSCFSRIIDGESPNEAFNWIQRKGLTAWQKEERAMIGHKVAMLMKKNGGTLTLDQACEEVANKYNHISPDVARQAYNTYMAL